jgi:16S rRNA (uracil1498-N3)-methyltransferase
MEITQLRRVTVSPKQILHQQVCLTAEQQHYLRRVLRLQSNDQFIAIDGQGQGWLASLGETTDACLLEPIAFQTELPLPVLLLVGLSKGNSMDEIVRQATELGVSGIVPVLSDRTLLDPSPQKLQRWRRIAQEATEQAERPFMPMISDPLSWKQTLAKWHRETAYCYLCVARGEALPLLNQLMALRKTLSAAQRLAGTIAIATGPEGGWTPTEVEQAIAVGHQPVSLGARILRAVTAPITALSITAAVLESEISHI